MWPFTRKAGTHRKDSSTDGCLVYAVGDIHGRLDLLRLLGDQIVEDAATRITTAEAATGKPVRSVLIFLGDYVDRGPHSRDVIEYLSRLHERTPEVICLKGNHEQVMLNFIETGQGGPAWIGAGGYETLTSYGVEPPARDADSATWEQARAALEAAMPQHHLAFLRGLALQAVVGDYLFVHAGVRPQVDLAEQTETDLLWIRHDFLRTNKACDKVVVHGHTPADEAHLGRWRIGIDTGAYATGVLSAVRLFGTSRQLLQVRPA